MPMTLKTFPKLGASLGKKAKQLLRRVRLVPCHTTTTVKARRQERVIEEAHHDEDSHAKKVTVVAEDVAVRVGSAPTGAVSSTTREFDLPFETTLAVFMFLDVPDLLRVTQVSRFFRDVADSHAIWHAMLTDYLMTCKTLVLDDFIHPSSLPLPELKKVLARSHRLYHNWDSEHPKQIAKHTSMKLDKHLPGVQDGGPYYIADEFMILPESNGTLTCIDTKNDRVFGQCELSESAFPLLFSHTESASVYVVVTDYTSSVVKLTVRQAALPSGKENMTFSLIREYNLSRRWGIITKVVDVDRRRLCMLFLHPWPESNTMKLFVVLDWNDNTAVFLDSGLPYKGRHTGAVIRFSDDGEQLTVFSEREDGILRQHRYSISELKKVAQSLDKGTDLCFHTLPPLDVAAFTFDDPFPGTGLGLYSDNVTMFQYWNSTYAQSWLKLSGLPPFFSYLYLMVGVSDAGEKKFRVAQFYTTEDQPCHIRRAVFELGNPVRVPFEGDELPLMSLSFNHLCWIDQSEASPRVMKLVSFPDPFRRDNLDIRVRTLDIPDTVLKNAAHVFMVPALGSIMILSDTQHLHRFQYA